MSTITLDEADDVLYGEHKRQLVSEHRWYDKYLIIFEREGDLVGFYYDQPATEDQEGQDVFEAIPVPIFPVVGRDVVTTTYAPIPDA